MLIFHATIEAQKINMEPSMVNTNIFQKANEVESKLSVFDITKEALRDVALEAAAQRNNATLLHPINAGGMFSYMWGTKALRQALLPKGWKIDRTNGVEAVSHKTKNLTLVFQNVDVACGENAPLALSSKGEGSKSLVENNHPYLFDYMQREDDEKANKNVWFFCVSFHGDEIKAELSLPESIEKGQFGEFIERIFVISDDDWLASERIDHNADQHLDETEDFDIKITRKK